MGTGGRERASGWFLSPGRHQTARTAKIALTGLKWALYSIVAQMQHPQGK